MTIQADSTTADLGVSTQVLNTKVGNKITKTSVTTHELAGKKKKRGDGMPTIADQNDLRSALKTHAEEPSDQLRKHITRRAYSIGAAHLIPKEWRDMQLEKPQLNIDLAMSAVATDARTEILAEGGYDPLLPPIPAGVMRVRVPFYVGESTVKIGGFSKPLYFPTDALPGIVAEGNRQIGIGNAPNITSYARHAHAESASHLPIGKVIKLEQVGSVGYGIVDIAPTRSGGRDVQILIEAGQLNSVSLRASDYEDLQDVKINGEPAFAARIKRLEGIDFAPDGPAMPTFGVTRLAAEAVVVAETVIDSEEESASTPAEEEVVDFTTLTLEQIKAERPDLVKAIETPFSDKVTALTSELETAVAANKVLAEKVTKSEMDAEVAKVAAMFPDPAAALVVIAEACKNAKTAAEVAMIALPLVAEAYKTAGATAPATVVVTAESVKTSAQVLAEMIAPGKGQAIVAELKADEGVEKYGGLAVPSR